MKKILLFIMIFSCFRIFSVTNDEILKIIDNNEIFDTIRYEGEMIIHISGKEYRKEFYGYAEGEEKYYMEFTNPDDEGTKYLKIKGTVYVYTEDLEEVMPITGHMLKESMMGSDMSFEDANENNKLYGVYNVTSREEIEYEGKPAYKMELKAKNKMVTYPKKILIVDRENYAVYKEELFSLSGVALKEVTVNEYYTEKGKHFPTEIVMRDLLRSDSKTIFRMNDLELDVKINSSIFTIRNLER